MLSSQKMTACSPQALGSPTPSPMLPYKTFQYMEAKLDPTYTLPLSLGSAVENTLQTEEEVLAQVVLGARHGSPQRL